MTRLFHKYIILYSFNIILWNILSCSSEKTLYIITEHPKVTYLNHKYVEYANITSVRYGRSSPIYYVSVHGLTKIWGDRNLLSDFYFYEYLSNVYKRSFVEMHFNSCSLMLDKFFASMKQGNLTGSCPYPPGEYHLYNLSVDTRVIPRTFPFRKGRIYINVSRRYSAELVGSVYIDMEIKEMNLKKRN